MKKIVLFFVSLFLLTYSNLSFWYTMSDNDLQIANSAYSKLSNIIDIKQSDKYSIKSFVNALTKLRDSKFSQNERLSAIIDKTIDSLNKKGVIDYFVVSIFLDWTWTGSNWATTIAEMDKMRSQLTSISPNIKVSWAFTNNFVFHEYNRPKLAHVLEMVDKYWDEISIWSGFPNNQYDIKQWTYMMKEWVYRYRYNAFTNIHSNWTMEDPVWIFNSIPAKYRPTSLTTYAINHEQADWVRTKFGINTFMWWTATQYWVDQLSWEGSPLMPYWSHINNPMIPAQDSTTNSKSIFLNTITIDPIGSSHTWWESRWTIHPADPSVWWLEQIYTVNEYLNNPYKDKNTINYLSLFVDINWMLRDEQLSKNWDYIIANWPKDNKVKVIWLKQFWDIWRNTAWTNNDKLSFTLLFRGSWITKKIYTSSGDIQFLRTETKTERIILKKTDSDNSWSIIDFTDYTRQIPKLKYTTKGNTEDLSYITGRNFKLTPTAPLTQVEIARVKARLIELKFSESVNYED